METLKINVYDDDDKIIKTCEAKPIDLKFGPVRSLMKLLKVDDINDTADLLKTIYDVWEQLTAILSKCFPEMEEKDWDNVKLNELIPTVVEILKVSFAGILSIPKDPKN